PLRRSRRAARRSRPGRGDRPDEGDRPLRPRARGRPAGVRDPDHRRRDPAASARPRRADQDAAPRGPGGARLPALRRTVVDRQAGRRGRAPRSARAGIRARRGPRGARAGVSGARSARAPRPPAQLLRRAAAVEDRPRARHLTDPRVAARAESARKAPGRAGGGRGVVLAVSTKVPKRGRRYQQRRRAQRRQPVTPSGRGRTSRASQPDRTVERYLALPYHVTLVRDGDGDDGPWVAQVEELAGCTSRAETAEQAASGIQQAMSDWITEALREGREVPEPKPVDEHSGRLLLRMPRTLHAELTRLAEREGVSLNQFITDALASAVGWRLARS